MARAGLVQWTGGGGTAEYTRLESGWRGISVGLRGVSLAPIVKMVLLNHIRVIDGFMACTEPATKAALVRRCRPTGPDTTAAAASGGIGGDGGLADAGSYSSSAATTTCLPGSLSWASRTRASVAALTRLLKTAARGGQVST